MPFSFEPRFLDNLRMKKIARFPPPHIRARRSQKFSRSAHCLPATLHATVIMGVPPLSSRQQSWATRRLPTWQPWIVSHWCDNIACRIWVDFHPKKVSNDRVLARNNPSIFPANIRSFLSKFFWRPICPASQATIDVQRSSVTVQTESAMNGVIVFLSFSSHSNPRKEAMG